MKRNVIRYDGSRVYPDSVFESATGRVDSDLYADYDEVVAVLPSSFNLTWEYWPNRSTPAVVPQTFDVVLGDANGTGDYVGSDLTLEKAMDMAESLCY